MQPSDFTDTLMATQDAVPRAALGQLLNALQAIRDGDFSVRLPVTGRACRASWPTRSTRSSCRTRAWPAKWSVSAPWSVSRDAPASV